MQMSFINVLFGHQVRESLVQFAGYKDRQKRRMSLPIGRFSERLHQSSVRSRRNSSTSQSSTSSYTESSSDDENDSGVSPREKKQQTAKGFSDFCVKNLGHSSFGRREIAVAEQGLYLFLTINFYPIIHSTKQITLQAQHN